MNNFTFLTNEQIFGNGQLDVLKKYGIRCAITDFSILLGGYVSSNRCTSEGKSLKNRTGWWWNKSSFIYDDEYVCVVDCMGDGRANEISRRFLGARPVLPYSSIESFSSNKVRGRNEILEVEYGEYPQTVVSEDFDIVLESAYQNGTIHQTGKVYTTDSVGYGNLNIPFQARTHIEYEYNEKKYIRFEGDFNGREKVLSDERIIEDGEVYWIEVEPIKWLVDEKDDIALCKNLIFSGVQFDREGNYEGDFNKTDIKKFMDRYFSKDIIPSSVMETKEISPTKQEDTKSHSINPDPIAVSEISYTENISVLEQINEFYESFEDERLKKIAEARMRIMSLTIDEATKNTILDALDVFHDLICDDKAKGKAKVKYKDKDKNK